MTESAQPEKGTVFVPVPALKQMISWSLLCLGILERKDEDFDVAIVRGGVIVRTKR